MTHKPSMEEFSIGVVNHLQHAGYVAYWVGGCVRDRLMGRPAKDYDVATSATPEQVLTLFPRGQKVGAAFGVILIRERQRQVEVATFRADAGYSNGRHPDAVRFTHAEEDARRRDFTCNGLFFDPATQQLHDYVGGQKDIEAKILRAIGDPEKRFAEDHLRMLRAIRFTARLEFSIDPATRLAIDAHQQQIARISRERIGEEMRMMLEHPMRVPAMDLFASFPRMFEEVFGFHVNAEMTDRDWPTLSGLPSAVNRVVALAAILQDAAVNDAKQSAASLRTQLVLSNAETEELAWLCDQLPALQKWEDLSKASFKRIMADPRWKDLEMLYCADPNNAEQLFAFNERIEALQDEGVAPPPFITGDMLISFGARPGRMFKNWLDQLYDRQLNGELATQEDAVAAAKTIIT